MSIQPLPPAATAGIAGTQRAAAKSGDLDNLAASVAGQRRAEKPAGAVDGIAHVERDAATGDSEADGRQMYQQPQRDPDDPQNPPRANHHSVSDEAAGNLLDLDA